MKKLLPQANTLSTVIRTFRLIGNTSNITLGEIAEFNSFNKRQASYYSNACYFLGLIDENLCLTTLGEEINREPKNTRYKIYETIIGHELIGQLFAKAALYSPKNAVKESKAIVWKLYPDYSEAVINRRTKCMLGWCYEIIEYMKSKK